jgi:hypothetical protein
MPSQLPLELIEHIFNTLPNNLSSGLATLRACAVVHSSWTQSSSTTLWCGLCRHSQEEHGSFEAPDGPVGVSRRVHRHTFRRASAADIASVLSVRAV